MIDTRQLHPDIKDHRFKATELTNIHDGKTEGAAFCADPVDRLFKPLIQRWIVREQSWFLHPACTRFWQELFEAFTE